jgi:bifunctional DNA-binding transcriptional regulator/antitoxin component of YhaV-PrlF toxin-antitoxin module
VREALKIEPNSKLEWEVKDGAIIVHPLPADPIRAALGFFRNSGLPEGRSLTDELLEDRRRDLEKDEEMVRRLGLPDGD